MSRSRADRQRHRDWGLTFTAGGRTNRERRSQLPRGQSANQINVRTAERSHSTEGDRYSGPWAVGSSGLFLPHSVTHMSLSKVLAMAEHKFKIGQRVCFHSKSSLSSLARLGHYKVIKRLPAAGRGFQYVVRCEDGLHECVASERDLASA